MSISLCKKINKLPSVTDLRTWIEQQASQYGLVYLLGHADDGVIWGRFDEGKLTTADQVLTTADQIKDRTFKQLPTLKFDTLQQCRIFGKSAEVLLWKSYGKFNARVLSDVSDEPSTTVPIQEEQLVWGTHGIQYKGFTLLRDGSQGLKHALPITEGIQLDSDSKLVTQPCLVVNHYIDYDDDGLAHISNSRLVDIKGT